MLNTLLFSWQSLYFTQNIQEIIVFIKKNHT